MRYLREGCGLHVRPPNPPNRWSALVLTPREIVAHHKDDIVSHSCDIDGSAYGVVEGGKADIRDWGKVNVQCTHY